MSDVAELARAICLRGIMATYSTTVTFVVDGAAGGDSFEGAWEELPSGVQLYWLRLANIITRVSKTPAWEGALK